jgi:hypothetical protein
MSWETYHQEASGSVRDISVSIRDTNNTEIMPITNITNDTAGYSTSYQTPAVNSLTGNRYMLAYMTQDSLVYSVYDSAGSMVKTTTSIGTWGYQPDIVQLSNGKIVMVYIVPGEPFYGIGYVIINGSTYAKSIGPNTLSNPYTSYDERGVSVTADQNGRAAIMSYDEGGTRIYYSLIDGNGGCITSPMIVYSGSDSSYISTNTTGYSITSYHLTTSAGVDDNITSTNASLAASGSYASVPVIYRNAGATTSTGVTITATLDAGLTYWYDTSGITPSHVGNEYTWVIPDLEFLDGNQFEIYLWLPTAASGTAYPVSLEISANETDANPPDNVFNLNVVIAYFTNLPMIIK